ncbi:hypothetical protein RIF29_21040 [Crotalaria pallida]|uniref:Uncharacterized protein n=1 Tax=Crotalaria pallida TaxID=3830 RepID=A0AAN9I6V3_CROPI
MAAVWPAVVRWRRCCRRKLEPWSADLNRRGVAGLRWRRVRMEVLQVLLEGDETLSREEGVENEYEN